MWEKLTQYFSGRGLKEVNLNRDDMRLYYTAEGKAADTIWMINNAAVAALTKEKYGRYLETIRSIFIKQGFETVSMLTLFVSGRIGQCKEIGEDTAYWIVDAEYGRLIIYENQPEDFLGIRSVIENNLHFGGHSRNAEGAQTDLNNNNLRAASRVTAYGRDAVTRVDKNRANAYLEAQRRQNRYRAGQRRSGLQNVCIVTAVLIAVNLIIFLLTDLFSMESILEKGQMSWHTVVTEHGYYRLFTCMFLHYGIDHVGGNMIALYALGGELERHMFRVRYVILYLVSGLGASVVSCVYYHYFTDIDPYSVGASGAIYGLMGAFFMMLIMHPEQRQRNNATRVVIFVAYLIYSFVGADGNVNLAAHFGGLVFGAILYPILEKLRTKRLRQWDRKKM